MFKYPVDLRAAAEGGFVVTFQDVPGRAGSHHSSDDLESALLSAVDALKTAIDFYVESGRDLPRPSDAAGRPLVGPSSLGAAKLAVYTLMRRHGVPKAELASVPSGGRNSSAPMPPIARARGPSPTRRRLRPG